MYFSCGLWSMVVPFLINLIDYIFNIDIFFYAIMFNTIIDIVVKRKKIQNTLK